MSAGGTGSEDGPAGVAEVPGSRLSALTYDPFMWLSERRGMAERRRRVVGEAAGETLELGSGTGLNLAHYPAAVTRLVLTEPDPHMAGRLRGKVERLGRPAEIVAATAEELPFEGDSFDTVVSTLVLCTVADPARAIAEISRVLRPDGRLLFCEHVRAESPRLARWQDRLRRPWAAFADGCQCNRPTVELLEAGGLSVSARRERWRGMPPVVRPLAVGEAVSSG